MPCRLISLLNVLVLCAVTFNKIAANDVTTNFVTNSREDGLMDMISETLSSSNYTSNSFVLSVRHLLTRIGFKGNEMHRLLSSYATTIRKNSDELLSEGCIHELKSMLYNSSYQKVSRMFDASGKPGDGIAEGNFYWLGSYKECKETQYSHFCISKVKLSNYPITIGLCVSKECTNQDVFLILDTIANLTNRFEKKPVLQVFKEGIIGTAYSSPVYCDEPSTLSSGNIIAICFVAFFGMLVLVGTVVDYVSACSPEKIILSKNNSFMPVKFADDDVMENIPVNENGPFLARDDVKTSGRNFCQEMLMCFSFRKNATQIFDTKVPSSAISCLNGIRTLSMFWVILGHTFYFALYAPSDNPLQGFKFIHRFSFQAIANAYFSVDTFFLLSGLLVSYLTLKRLDKYDGESFHSYFGKSFLPQFYIHRFLRLTPVYLFVIFFYIFIYPLCGDGPLWFKQAKGVGIENCKKYWWTNLLYVNNFYPRNMASECIGWSWYLANDMQFYVLSPFIVLIMYRLKLLGAIFVNSSICIGSFLATGIIIGVKNLNALLTGDFQEATGNQAQEFADLIYSKPYSRIPPYIVGLTLGYLLHSKKQPRNFFRTLIGFVGWMFATGVALSATYGPYTSFRDGGRPFTLFENVLYGTFSRFAWSLCVAWVVFASHFQMGGVINSLLSWKAFTPLSRLTYTAYLLHPIVIQIFYSSFETPLHFSNISIAYYYVSFLLMTYASAFLLAVCVEYPISNLEKLAFSFQK